MPRLCRRSITGASTVSLTNTQTPSKPLASLAVSSLSFVSKNLNSTSFSTADFSNVVIAYEPIWAIGTGKSCDAVEANRTIGEIRKVVAKLYSQDVADKIRILYGGSVKPSTIVEQMAQPEIDGGLIGGASLQADSFVDLIKGAM